MNEVWKRNEIESPCVQVCLIDPTSKYCIGCGRTGAEIARWSNMSPEDRRKIMEKLPTRLKNAKPSRRGGRSKKLR